VVVKVCEKCKQEKCKCKKDKTKRNSQGSMLKFAISAARNGVNANWVKNLRLKLLLKCVKV